MSDNEPLPPFSKLCPDCEGGGIIVQCFGGPTIEMKCERCNGDGYIPDAMQFGSHLHTMLGEKLSAEVYKQYPSKESDYDGNVIALVNRNEDGSVTADLVVDERSKVAKLLDDVKRCESLPGVCYSGKSSFMAEDLRAILKQKSLYLDSFPSDVGGPKTIEEASIAALSGSHQPKKTEQEEFDDILERTSSRLSSEQRRSEFIPTQQSELLR